jgi:hypothetical protein
VFEEQQRRCIEQYLPLFWRQLLQLTERILSCQQPLLFQRPQAFLLAPRFQHE